MGLLAVVVYLYTVVAFNFFRKFYNKSEDEDEPDMKCDDMMTVCRALRLLQKKQKATYPIRSNFLLKENTN